MIIQWILQVLAGTIVGCVIGYFLIRIFTKLRVLLFRKRSNRYKKEIDQFQIEQFYKIFGFYYEDIIKYAPELDEFLSDRIYQPMKDDVELKMHELVDICRSIHIIEQIDIIKFKQTIENIKNQKALENIDG
jgi:hypothetical protein